MNQKDHWADDPTTLRGQIETQDRKFAQAMRKAMKEGKEMPTQPARPAEPFVPTRISPPTESGLTSSAAWISEEG